jgi:hypothetical protein
LLGDVNKLFVFKSLLTMPNNDLPLHLKQTFLPIIWIFTEGDSMEFRQPFEIFSTVTAISPKEIFRLRNSKLAYNYYSKNVKKVRMKKWFQKNFWHCMSLNHFQIFTHLIWNRRNVFFIWRHSFFWQFFGDFFRR